MQRLNDRFIRLKLLLPAILLTFCNFTAQGQSSSSFVESYQSYQLSHWSIGGGTGIVVFNGDLHDTFDGSSQNNFLNFHATGFLQYRFTNHLSWRGQASFYQIFTKPSEEDEYKRFAGNPAVKSSNLEVFGSLRYDLVSKDWIERGESKWNVYGLIGAGLTYFEPKDAVTGENLRAPDEESDFEDGKRYYTNVIPMMPFGIGVNHYFTDNQAITLEIIYRSTLSDWMDNTFSRKDESRNADHYLFIGFNYEFTFLAGKRNRSKRNRRKWR